MLFLVWIGALAVAIIGGGLIGFLYHLQHSYVKNQPFYQFLNSISWGIGLVGFISSIFLITVGAFGIGTISLIIAYGVSSYAESLTEKSYTKQKEKFFLNNLSVVKEYLEKVKTIMSTFEFNEKNCVKYETFNPIYDSKLYWVYESYLVSIPSFLFFEGVHKRSNKFNIKDILGTLYSAFRVSDNPNLILESKDLKRYFPEVIQIDKIHYYSSEGEVSYVTEVTGGGSSLRGAILGGILAGEVGAIIGSRETVKSSTREIDNRKVIFVYEFKGKLIKEKLDNEYSIVFDTLIPEKDIKYVMAQDRIKSGRKY